MGETAARKDRDRQPPWWLLWVPFLVVGLFIGLDEGPDLLNAALARMGAAVSVPGAPPEALRRLLDKGDNHRAAVAVRRMIAEVPFFPLVAILLALFVTGIVYPRLLSIRGSDWDPSAFAPPAWFPAASGLVAAVFLALALVDVLGERFTIEADVWALAIGAWCGGACSFSLSLRRRAASAPPSTRG